jgi:hypothetical protein
MSLLGRIASIHIINATPWAYHKRKPQLYPLVILVVMLLLVLLGKLT